MPETPGRDACAVQGCHREEANLISQDAALGLDVHPPSLWQHGSDGTTWPPRVTGMEDWRLQEGWSLGSPWLTESSTAQGSC